MNMIRRPRRRSDAGRGPTKAERLLELLTDGRWHATRQLVRRVGHSFAVAMFVLRSRGHVIERERHPTRRRQFRYRQREDLPF